MVAKTPQGPPSCCTRPIDVSGSGLNLQDFRHVLANKMKTFEASERLLAIGTHLNKFTYCMIQSQNAKRRQELTCMIFQ